MGAMTDPIADMLTRIRNAARADHEETRMPSSTLKVEIARILQTEGYIKSYQVVEESHEKILRIVLKYGPSRQHMFQEMRRVSSPGKRQYVTKDRIPRVIGGLGIAILSTSRGVVTDSQARALGVGGEILCTVW